MRSLALRTQLRLAAVDQQAEVLRRLVGSLTNRDRQISRYENARITPSLDVLARIAQALDISLNHRVFDDIPRRPLHAKQDVLGDRLAAIAELTTKPSPRSPTSSTPSSPRADSGAITGGNES